MRAHHHVRAGGDAGPKRHQLQRVEAPVVGGNDREPDVRVRLGVAVAGEVLQRGEHAVVVQPPHVGLDQA